MFFNFKVCLTTCFCTWIFTEPKNCYRWFPMTSGHRTAKIVIHGIWNPRACILYYTVNWLFPRTTVSTGQSRNCLCYDRTIKLKSHSGKGICFQSQKSKFLSKVHLMLTKIFTKTVQIQLHERPFLDHTLRQQIALCVVKNFCENLCGSNNFLLLRQTFSPKFFSTHEVICRFNMLGNMSTDPYTRSDLLQWYVA